MVYSRTNAPVSGFRARRKCVILTPETENRHTAKGFLVLEVVFSGLLGFALAGDHNPVLAGPLCLVQCRIRRSDQIRQQIAELRRAEGAADAHGHHPRRGRRAMRDRQPLHALA